MIDVACAADEAYAPHASAMLSSVLSASEPQEVRVHVLHPADLDAGTIAKLREMVEQRGGSITFYDGAEAVSGGLPGMADITSVMWYRLALPQLLPTTGRVLYLDCDTLVLDPLGPLWEEDLAGAPVAAVTNVFPPDLVHRPDVLGIARSSYFNSGVLLMDLDVWRAERVGERILSLARSAPERLVFPDQDALNIELHARWHPLHPRWNCQNGLLYFATAEDLLGPAAAADARAHPAILHFEGRAWAKPWHYLSTHPFQQAYLGHRAQTPWPVTQLEGKTFANVLRRNLPSPARRAVARSRARIVQVLAPEVAS